MTTVVAAVIKRDRKILICQRSASGPHPLKWEFPGGKVEQDEREEQALRRELQEELAIEAEIGKEITRYHFTYPGKKPILLIFYEVNNFTGESENRVFESIAWADPESLTTFEFLEGDIDFVRTLTEQAKAGS